MNYVANDILMHYGMPRRSGRYPWGSGENPYQHSGDWLSRVHQLEKSGISEKEIAEQMDITTTQLRTLKSIAKNYRRADEVARAKGLKEKGYSTSEIARQMGYANESSVRSLLNSSSEMKMNEAQVTARYLKEMVDQKGMIDVGAGVERELNVSKEKLKQALYILEMEGYPTYGGGLPQATNPGKQTNLKVLCPPNTEHKDIYNYGEIHQVKDYEKILTDDGQAIRKRFEYPASMDSDRLMIRYAEDGGIDKDGVIELRRNVKDISLGESHYAQVRILVDGDRYLKGMAIYSDDMPDGVDIIFNTNKSSNVDKRDVLKKIKSDPDNPFGALIKENGGQSYYDDPNGKFTGPDGQKQSLNLVNKTREEGDWSDWNDSLPSQFLAKQNKELMVRQLNLAKSDKNAEFDEICSLTNPTVKKVLLKSFADDCDAAAVHLQAAALPRQHYRVILPLNTIKDNEIYAPTYVNGEKVALIRYPHGGTFEIPILTVNNKQPEGRKILGQVKDAVGINKNVADRLSGADFDGDAVMVIPVNEKVKITSRPYLKGLIGFDPKIEYGPDSTNVPYKKLSKGAVQGEMGKISNLITDMTLKGANDDEVTRAVKHSMVIIDAEKHKLDYKRSEEENGIPALKKKYQGRVEDGRYTESASTLISRAKGEKAVLKRQGNPKILPDGSLEWKVSDNLEYIDPKTGKKKVRTQKSTQMAEAKDARYLSSGTPQEEEYADYANFMKSLANKARKEMINTGNLKYSASAKDIYKEEVDKLKADLNLAKKNAPKERQAQIMARIEVDAKKLDNRDMTKAEVRKISQQALTKARASVGAERYSIPISDRQWEAIQAGAISDHMLSDILNNTDIDLLREKAMPREKKELSTSKINMINAMNNSGYTIQEIADRLSVSTSTVEKYL